MRDLRPHWPATLFGLFVGSYSGFEPRVIVMEEGFSGRRDIRLHVHSSSSLTRPPLNGSQLSVLSQKVLKIPSLPNLTDVNGSQKTACQIV